MHKNRGVKFLQRRELIRIDHDEKNPNQVSKVNVRGKAIDTDLFVLFSDNFIPNTEFIVNRRYLDNMEFTSEGQVCVDPAMNTNAKRIFAAGDIAAPVHFFTLKKLKNKISTYKSTNEGYYAAVNMLGLVFILCNLECPISKRVLRGIGHLPQLIPINRSWNTL